MAKRAGRPPFKPTDEQRKMVEMFAACGIPQEEIARVVSPGGIAKHTLQKHFREELDTGVIKANALIAGTLFNKAKAGDTASVIFWLKTRARWRETNVHELVGKDGAPIKAEIIVATGIARPAD